MTASFAALTPNQHALTLEKHGSGTGTVSGGGISCGATCSVSVADGTAVTLTATPDAGSTFAGWSGCDSTSGATCTCTMTAGRTVTASFTACGVASVRVQDAVAAIGGTAALTAAVSPAGSCAPSLEADWTTDGCPGASVSPARGASTVFHAPASAGNCRVVAKSVADPGKFDFAYVIVSASPREPLSIYVGPQPYGMLVWTGLAGGYRLSVASTGAGTLTTVSLSYMTVGSEYVGANPRGDMAWDPVIHGIWISLTGEDKVVKNHEKYDAGAQPHGVLWTVSGLWVADYGSDKVTKLDRISGAVLATYDIGQWGHAPTGIAYDGSTYWVATTTGVLHLRGDGQLIPPVIPAADAYGITYDGTYVWFSNHASNTVVRVTPGSGSTATFKVGNSPLGISPGGGGTVWVANTGDDTVCELRATDGAILATLKTGPMPYGVVFFDGSLWVTDYGADDVRRLF
nr:hypothetical protein [Anaeromyxobacter diazotrophicus]